YLLFLISISISSLTIVPADYILRVVYKNSDNRWHNYIESWQIVTLVITLAVPSLFLCRRSVA
ncbi:hypothetical protein V1951_10480, partial [Yersinia sp. 2544 StPb PI]|uniref:hypothetical protein n=1 Tax=Yersinia sp. 2544 StPb PI TaxID=3117409 RepID=UPI003B286698